MNGLRLAASWLPSALLAFLALAPGALASDPATDSTGAASGIPAPIGSARSDSAPAASDSVQAVQPPSIAPLPDSSAQVKTDSVATDSADGGTGHGEEPRTLSGTQAGSTVTIRGQARHKRKEVSSQTLTREEIRKVVATAQDPLRALPTLPGVTTSSDLSVRPIVRGGDLSETGVELDGIPLLMPYHFGSAFSIFHQEALEDFQLYSGVAPARAEGALSGTVLARTRPPRADSLLGGVDISLLRSSAWLGVPVVKDKLGLWVSGQTMWYDWTLKRILDLSSILGLSDKKSVDQFEEEVTMPTSWDVQAGLSYRIQPGLLLDVGGFLAGDRYLVRQSITVCQLDGREVPCWYNPEQGISRYRDANGNEVCYDFTQGGQKQVPCPTPIPVTRTTAMDTSAAVDLTNWMARTRLAWNPDPDLAVEIVAGLQSSDWQVRFPGERTYKQNPVDSTFSVVRVSDSSEFSWNRIAADLQLSGRKRWNRDHETSLGFSVRRESEDVETALDRPVAELILGTTGNPLEFLGVYNQREVLVLDGPTDLITLDRLSQTDFRYSSSTTEYRPSGWLEHRWDPDPDTRVRAGVRLSGTESGGMEIPSPRVQVQRKVTENDLLGIGAALHTQSDLPFEWKLSARQPLEPEKAWIGIVEWEHSFAPGWRTTLTGWGKWYQDLASPRVFAAGAVDTARIRIAMWNWVFANQKSAGIPDSLMMSSYHWDPDLPDSVNSLRQAESYAQQYRAVLAYVPESFKSDAVYWSTPHHLEYASTGVGWAAGMEASIHYHPTEGWTGWGSVEWSVSRRKDFEDGIWYPFGLERPWKISWVNAFRVDRTWELSVRYSAVAGNPYTPFKLWNLSGIEATGSTSDTTLWIGSRNSASLAAYQRLDLRISKESTVFGHPATWYWEVWNAFNDPNFILRDASSGEFRWIDTNIPIPVVFVGVQTRF